MVAQVYVNDIIFGFTKDKLAKSFSLTMQSEFRVSLVGKLKFFLKFQVKQIKDMIFLSQVKYTKELVKRFILENTNHACTFMSTTLKFHQDPSRKEVEQTLYQNQECSLLDCQSYRNIFQYRSVCQISCQHKRITSFYSQIDHQICYWISKYNIWFPRDITTKLVGFFDADQVGGNDDRKSI